MEGQKPSEGDLAKVKEIYDKLMKEKGMIMIMIIIIITIII